MHAAYGCGSAFFLHASTHLLDEHSSCMLAQTSWSNKVRQLLIHYVTGQDQIPNKQDPFRLKAKSIWPMPSGAEVTACWTVVTHMSWQVMNQMALKC